MGKELLKLLSVFLVFCQCFNVRIMQKKRKGKNTLVSSAALKTPLLVFLSSNGKSDLRKVLVTLVRGYGILRIKVRPPPLPQERFIIKLSALPFKRPGWRSLDSHGYFSSLLNH
jgi:hypothetical protein